MGQPHGAVEEAEQRQVDEERAEVDQQVADQARRDDLGQPERKPPGDRRHHGREARLVCHGLHCDATAALLGRPGSPAARDRRSRSACENCHTEVSRRPRIGLA